MFDHFTALLALFHDVDHKVAPDLEKALGRSAKGGQRHQVSEERKNTWRICNVPDLSFAMETVIPGGLNDAWVTHDATIAEDIRDESTASWIGWPSFSASATTALRVCTFVSVLEKKKKGGGGGGGGGGRGFL